MLGAATLGLSVSADSPSTKEVRVACVKAAEGDITAELECVTSIRKQADAMLVDELDPDFQTSCLFVEPATLSDLVWIYLEWLDAHPDADAKPAAITINTALLEALPCGWRER